MKALEILREKRMLEIEEKNTIRTELLQVSTAILSAILNKPVSVRFDDADNEPMKFTLEQYAKQKAIMAVIYAQSLIAEVDKNV